MKKLLITAMALSCFALSYGQKKVEKQIIGKWCNPYTYKSTGELKGFEFKKGGKCSASKEDDGKVEVYKTRERIGYLTSDSLQLIVNEGTPRLAFLYLNTKSIKELVTPEVK